MDDWRNGVFALPCGVDFAGEFVRGFLDRMAGQPPEVMARSEIWANSSRTLTTIAEAFDRYGPLLLPQMRVVTDLGAGDGPLVAPLARRLELGRLIAALLDARPDLAQGQSIPHLAESLSALMSEMQNEGCDADALDRIDAGNHAHHWQNALQFLRIAARYHLDGATVDRAARQRATAEARAEAWADGRDLPAAPVIVAGSTGSHGATRLFMQAVARLPLGAVVLPGYDFDLPLKVWDRLAEDTGDHPQSRYHPFHTGGVGRWTDAQPPAPARNALISLALRPVPVTDQWIEDGPALGDLIHATENLSLIEADQPGQEAEAIAALIRAEVEHDRPVTLIANDRGLTRRVAAALDRWGIRADDSAGQPLPLSPPGRFLRHLAALPGQALTIDALLVILKHPLALTGSALLPRAQANIVVRDLELHLRRHGPAFPDPEALRSWGATDDRDRKRLADWLAEVIETRIAPHADDRAPRPVPDRLAWLRDLAETVAGGPKADGDTGELWQEDAGAMALSVMDHLATHAAASPDLTPGDFADLVMGEMQARAVRLDAGTHPLICIRGPREARVNGRGTVILAGLNDGGWPAPPEPDPWLSRPMRIAAGLTLPERTIGLAAHDFQQGVAAGCVVLSRARRDAEAETIPSRWLNRLMNLMAGLPDQRGPEALEAMRARGAQWLALAATLAEPRAKLDAAKRPAPVPPAPALTQLPVTSVGTLIRDPYAVYARRVLRLSPLDPLRPKPDAALRGQMLHRIVERWLTDPQLSPGNAAAMAARLIAVSEAVLATDVPWPAARAFWRARIAGVAAQLAQDECRRRESAAPVLVEREGRVSLPALGFTLTAKPDRVDLDHAGRAQVYDYKSGAPPSQKQIETFDLQLPLQAAMIERGAFPDLGTPEVAGISFVQLGGEGATIARKLPEGGTGAVWDQFVTLIQSYLSGHRGFMAMRVPPDDHERGDYVHLSRFGEWALTDSAAPVRVGDHQDG